MGFAVCHINKASGNDAGMTAHIERTIQPKNADSSRTHLNMQLIEYPEGVTNRTEAIQHRLETAGITRKIGTNQVRALRVMLSGTTEDMHRIESEGRLDEWCADNLKWLRETFGADNVVSADLHLDEKTPHIHATVVPIVSGERRKVVAKSVAKQVADSTKPSVETAKPKKTYRKRPANTVRLCADDVMTRKNLEKFQDTYAATMSKFGLHRGIKGSDARHINTPQYYRDLYAKNETLKKDIVTKQSELQQVKSKLKSEKFKNITAEAGTKIAQSVGALFGTTRIERQQQEITTLKAENAQQKQEITYLTQTITHERGDHETALANLKTEFAKIHDWLPDTPQLVKWGEYCHKIGFTKSQARELIAMRPVCFTGELYSHEHNQRFPARDMEARLSKRDGFFNLLLDGTSITQWFREQYQKFKQAFVRTHQSRGRGI